MTTTAAHRRTRTSATPPAVRVAIYTRQSVERETAGDFGSIQNQREAVEAYVSSQRGLGWRALPDLYDDGGFSGKSTDRPAFQRLMADLVAGRVDVVAVYKIDRLSRSLLDFTRLMAEFEQRGVTFVSVTQSFDTRTSMGRLTLNILASFAEFEREQVSDRVKDKVAAARRKGLWTGGQPMLGYDAVDGRLAVNTTEAATVRAIYGLYVETGSLIDVIHDLAQRGITNKAWTNKAGKPAGGQPFNKGTLRYLLSNPRYTGKMPLGDELFAGQHDAIVEQATWDAAQQRLHRHTTERRPWKAWNSLLGGLLRCGCGAAMSHHSTTQHGRTYRAYVCQKVIKNNAAACPGSRVRAQDIEAAVVGHIRTIGPDRGLQRETVAAARTEGGTAIDEAGLRQALRSFAVWDLLFVPEQSRILHLLIEQVVYTAREHEVAITLRDSGIKALAREGT